MIKHIGHLIISFHPEKMLAVKILSVHTEHYKCFLISLGVYLWKDSGKGNQVTEYETEK